MKRLSLVLVSVALVLGMAQCKKNVEPVVPGGGNTETVNLTLNVGGNSKVDVDTDTGAVTFESGDVIFVADETQGYLGYMSYDGGGTFSGAITTPTEGEHLYFYFIGNHGYGDVTITDDKITASISDQSEKLPVVSCNTSNEVYSTGVTSYTSRLKNKSALVKFNVTTSSTRNIYITGVNNTVTFTMGNTEPAYSQTDGGKIILNGTGNGDDTEKWAIMLPMAALAAGAEGTAASVSGLYTGSRPAIPAINVNDFNSTGIDMTVNTPNGIVPGLFTVNSDGDQVYFGRGNVEHVNGVYSFVGTQWTDHSGDGTLDKYYFNATQATSAVTSLNSANYLGRNDWRMLSSSELLYVFNTRTTVDGTAGVNHNWKWVEITDVKYEKNGANMVGGMLFPDGYGSVTGVASSMTSLELTTYTAVGCVFLPAFGHSENGINSSTFSFVNLQTSGSPNNFHFSYNSTNTTSNTSRGYNMRVVVSAE